MTAMVFPRTDVHAADCPEISRKLFLIRCRKVAVIEPCNLPYCHRSWTRQGSSRRSAGVGRSLILILWVEFVWVGFQLVVLPRQTDSLVKGDGERMRAARHLCRVLRLLLRLIV